MRFQLEFDDIQAFDCGTFWMLSLSRVPTKENRRETSTVPKLARLRQKPASFATNKISTDASLLPY